MMEGISQYLTDVQSALDQLHKADIACVIEILLQANKSRKRVFIVGNGGSAATASHFACDLSKGASVSGLPRFGVIALTDNVPLITAWANDTDYQNVFAQQMVGLIQKNDVVIGISGSGNSPNVLNAVRLGRERGATTIGFTGFDGGQLKKLVDVGIHVPSFCMEQVEDVHLILAHLITTHLRNALQNSALADMARTHLSYDQDMQVLVQQLTNSLEVTIVSLAKLDESHGSLVLCAANPIRYLGGSLPIGTHIPLRDVPTYQRVIRKRQPVVFQQHEPAFAISPGELMTTLPADIKSGALLPLRRNGDITGVVSIGEMRTWDRAPFTEAKLNQGLALVQAWAYARPGPNGHTGEDADIAGHSNGHDNIDETGV